MTDDEARKLSQRIVDTWPAGSKGYVWRDVLVELDPTHAASAYRRCARTAHRAPTPSDFLDAYDLARAEARRADLEHHVPHRCESCDGTGWVQASTTEAHNPSTCDGTPAGGNCYCHAVKPCNCSNGSQAHRIVTLIHGTEIA